jgi:hypothetical protein
LEPFGNKDEQEGFRGERSWDELFHPERGREIDRKTISEKKAAEKVDHDSISE